MATLLHLKAAAGGARGNTGLSEESLSSGSIAIYLTLFILIVVTSSAVVLSNILSNQLRMSLDMLLSERAFYAASSGWEHANYKLSQKARNFSTCEELLAALDDTSGEISYGSDGNAQYSVLHGQYTGDCATSITKCILSEGAHHGEERRFFESSRECREAFPNFYD